MNFDGACLFRFVGDGVGIFSSADFGFFEVGYLAALSAFDFKACALTEGNALAFRFYCRWFSLRGCGADQGTDYN